MTSKPNIPRNAMCPCGSGKKFKRCCSAKQNQALGSPPFQTDEQNRSKVAYALSGAMEHHRAGRLRKAALIYREILDRQPEHSEALHLLGVVRHQVGEHADALALIDQSLGIQPTAAALNNKGEVLRALQRFDEALDCYRNALRLQTEFADAFRNMGFVFKDQGFLGQAEAQFREGIGRFPCHAGSYLSLGMILCEQNRSDEALAIYDEGIAQIPADLALISAKGLALKGSGKLDQAIAHYEQAISLFPQVSWLHHNLALVFDEQGDYTRAATCFEHELRLDPSAESAKHLLAALMHSRPERAPAAYVRETFDGCAEVFDEMLVDRLGYQTPRLLAQAIHAALGENTRRFDILDMGCGTGLFGIEIEALRLTLTGIDLSSKMIRKAELRKLYDRLIVADLLEYLVGAASNQFDLIAAVDVFIYVGNLEPVFEQVKRILPSDGRFVFSLEAAADSAADYTLDRSGRYQHGATYVPQLCAIHGFEVDRFENAVLRIEKGHPVDGFLYVLRKST
jgi:predicted TPR repeat methyltransferase